MNKVAVIALILLALFLSALGIADVYIFLLPYTSNLPVLGDIILWLIVIALFGCVCIVGNAAGKQLRQHNEIGF